MTNRLPYANNPHPGEHFRAEMEATRHDPERATGLVHRAYGEVPLGLVGDPAAEREAAGAAEEARAALVGEGWLTEDELASLSRDDAEALARRRFSAADGESPVQPSDPNDPDEGASGDV